MRDSVSFEGLSVLCVKCFRKCPAIKLLFCSQKTSAIPIVWFEVAWSHFQKHWFVNSRYRFSECVSFDLCTFWLEVFMETWSFPANYKFVRVIRNIAVLFFKRVLWNRVFQTLYFPVKPRVLKKNLELAWKIQVSWKCQVCGRSKVRFFEETGSFPNKDLTPAEVRVLWSQATATVKKVAVR